MCAGGGERTNTLKKTVTNNLGHKAVYVGPTECLPHSVRVMWGKVLRGVHPAHMTGVTEEMGVQREALRARFIRELLPTFLYGRENKTRNDHLRNAHGNAVVHH